MSDLFEDNQDEIAPENQLVVDLAGFEGPLDLMLSLARTHKLDLSGLSMLALAEQYIAYIDDLKIRRLELAADYLVMAAWLMYLKSKLLMPKEEQEEETLSGEEMAARLSFRLQRLEAMREAAAKLFERRQLGQDYFLRGMPETMVVHKQIEFEASPWDLISAYASLRQKQIVHKKYEMKKRTVWSIKQARQRLEKLLGAGLNWAPIQKYLMKILPDSPERKSVVASTFGASLELAREGHIVLRQDEPFGELLVKGVKTK